ncbi:hypothetical protein EDD21DRAFT_392089 [Dissophora ornata]|nr:hypothetical protein EDD21DRAFT_392089 [Dissophora ornata]
MQNLTLCVVSALSLSTWNPTFPNSQHYHRSPRTIVSTPPDQTGNQERSSHELTQQEYADFANNHAAQLTQKQLSAFNTTTGCNTESIKTNDYSLSTAPMALARHFSITP